LPDGGYDGKLLQSPPENAGERFSTTEFEWLLKV
jgi:hypothetical protein